MNFQLSIHDTTCCALYAVYYVLTPATVPNSNPALESCPTLLFLHRLPQKILHFGPGDFFGFEFDCFFGYVFKIDQAL